MHVLANGPPRQVQTSKTEENWIDTVRQDLKTIGTAWEEAEESAANREDWRRSVAQCVYDTGWPKSTSKHKLQKCSLF